MLFCFIINKNMLNKKLANNYSKSCDWFHLSIIYDIVMNDCVIISIVRLSRITVSIFVDKVEQWRWAPMEQYKLNSCLDSYS